MYLAVWRVEGNFWVGLGCLVFFFLYLPLNCAVDLKISLNDTHVLS